MLRNRLTQYVILALRVKYQNLKKPQQFIEDMEYNNTITNLIRQIRNDNKTMNDVMTINNI